MENTVAGAPTSRLHRSRGMWTTANLGVATAILGATANAATRSTSEPRGTPHRLSTSTQHFSHVFERACRPIVRLAHSIGTIQYPARARQRGATLPICRAVGFL